MDIDTTKEMKMKPDKEDYEEKHRPENDDGDDEQEEDDVQPPKYFGIKSYLHNFYGNVPLKNPDDYADYSANVLKTEKRRCTWWILAFISGSILMFGGILMLLVGYSYHRMKIDIGYQEEMRIIDKKAYEYNLHLEQFKMIGLVAFTIGGTLVASTLLLPSMLTDGFNENEEDEATHLRLNIDTQEEMETRRKNLIPVTEQVKPIQPKPESVAPTVITNSGLKQIHLN